MNEVKKIAYNKIDDEFSGGFNYFAKCIIDEILEYCENSLSEYSFTEANVHEAIDLILDLQLTLHWGKDDRTTHLYRCFNWKRDLLSPWCNDDFYVSVK